MPFKYDGLCSVEGCSRVGGGLQQLCSAHYSRKLRKGDAGSAFIDTVNSRVEWLESLTLSYRSECIIWPWGSSKKYPQVKWQGKKIGAHRLVCEMRNGPPPFECAVAAHNCGNGHKGCVNPMHLRWATPKENSLDAIKHGATLRGERSPTAKLTEEDVLSIRKSLANGVTAHELATAHSVTPQNISLIGDRKSWGWLDG